MYIYIQKTKQKKQFATPNNRKYNPKHLKGGVCNIHIYNYFFCIQTIQIMTINIKQIFIFYYYCYLND